MRKKHVYIILCVLVSFINPVAAQQKHKEKYPSLLWEITGNALTTPSYLFGTMHVSNKMVFHLSDSFYNAIKNTEAVALELNPDLWQTQMARLDKLKDNYSAFVQSSGNDYLTENSFRIQNYMDELKLALRSEPAIVNSLLYRSYKTKEDFEEDTFLDLYIFQTGRKLGKKAAGVENYYESEKLILEAYADMAREKNKKIVDLDGLSINEMLEKIQNAYRRGDLDLMDSLDLLMDRSDAFREKFLYKRNELQANSIDSIIRSTSLFAGVGAAHLPGDRGVIELLRRKGYRLRPVKMTGRNGLQKDIVDDMKVPVQFETRYANDLFYSVDVPGDLYKISQDYHNLDRRQYADMSNGSYYMVTRVKTHTAFLNQTENDLLKKVDSMLYENIPGKILSRKMITRNNYRGYDITSRTRRGDRQRYQIFATPFELIIFKMSGKENYIEGSEASRFFSSITFRELGDKSIIFEPAQGGFSISLPKQPVEFLNEVSHRWEYEAFDKATGDAYLIFKKSIYNYNFIDEDSFDLSLIEASFQNPALFDKQLSRRLMNFKGYTAMDVKEKLKNGSVIHARYIIQGPHYYVVAQKTNNPDTTVADAFLNSFAFKPYKYSPSKLYTDTFLQASVISPVIPEIDEEFRRMVERAADDAVNGNNYSGFVSYWLKPRNGIFKSDSTGEMITVKVQEYPKYFHIRDSAKFWQNEINDFLKKGDMLIAGQVRHVNGKNYTGLRFSLSDTGSSRSIEHLLLVKNNLLYNVTSMGDTLNNEGTFISSFFNSFKAVQAIPYRDLYQNRLKEFFSDLFSQDSSIQNKAQQALTSVYYGPAGEPMIIKAIQMLTVSDKNYFDTKSKLIAELGFIKDSLTNQHVINLKNIYDQAIDTGLFRNEVVKSLARLKTKASYKLLKEIFLQDPPIFENVYDYNTLFDNFVDSLQLSASLFPELLTLTSLDDYKEKIVRLLANLVDSGFVRAAVYEKYFQNIYIDAKVALKKQQTRDEKQMRAANKRDEDNEEQIKISGYESEIENLQDYSILLIPYHEKNMYVQRFFSALLRSRDETVQLNTAVLMIRNNLHVPDSLFVSLASSDQFRGILLNKLEKAGHAEKFPKQFKTQELLARSFVVQQNEYQKLDSIVFLMKQFAEIQGKKGMIYFYKYRIKKEDPWKIALSGLQPVNGQHVSSEDEFADMTDVKLKDNEPLYEQLNRQLKKLLFNSHKSGKQFFDVNDSYTNFRSLRDFEN